MYCFTRALLLFKIGIDNDLTVEHKTNASIASGPADAGITMNMFGIRSSFPYFAQPQISEAINPTATTDKIATTTGLIVTSLSVIAALWAFANVDPAGTAAP